MTTRIARAALPTPVGVLQLYGASNGLLSIALPNESRAEAEARLGRGAARHGAPQFVDVEAALAEALAQLRAWFSGERRDFDVPLAPRGTPFQLAVWEAVAAIPWGATCSYADIARRIGKPAAVRAVGAANGANPLPLIIPCHRVIGANGSLTGYGGGLPLKQQLLAWERGQTLLGGLG
jgi:methylated-DNA-[protein]-cysteine S-methyltransferase